MFTACGDDDTTYTAPAKLAIKSADAFYEAAGGTGIMMGAGNAAGRWLAPLIILSAVSYSIPAGIGAVIGSYIFLKLEKPMVGGTILGAIILAMIFPK